jgi:thiaminase/transcriptional activator TenA
LTEPSSPTFCSRLWAAAAGTYSAILDHPFIAGVVDGSLERASFQFYVLQDRHYLDAFARSLAHLAARAPSETVSELFARHTANVITVERSLHSRLLAELATMPGGGAEDPGIAPTTLAYATYLIATCATRSFSDGLAAVLPCYWIYRELGSELLARSSPDPLYLRWIHNYAGVEFGRAVREVLDLTDVIGATLTEPEQTSAIDCFATAARYEWMFWDAAYRRTGWPV